MKRCSVRPYEGCDKFIFISYCHKDKAYVFPIIEQLVKDGFRVWYDEGIAPGKDWPEIIAEHLNACDSCIAFISHNSLNSHNCKREINFALLKKKFFISVILEPVEMTLGMEMQLSTNQSILKYELNGEYEFFKKIYDANELNNCLGEPNPNVAISKHSDYIEEDYNDGEIRDTFSNSWFVSTVDSKNIYRKNPRSISENLHLKSNESTIDGTKEDELDSLLTLLKKKTEEIHQLKTRKEQLLIDEEENQKSDDEESSIVWQKIKEAEEAVRVTTETLLSQKEVVEQLKNAEDERKQAIEARKAIEKEEQIKTDKLLSTAEEELKKITATLKEKELEQNKANIQENVIKNIENTNNLGDNAKLNEKQDKALSTRFVLKRELNGQTFSIIQGSHIIGRSNTLAYYYIEGNKRIGRTHATIFASENEVVVLDNNSLNKTCINGSELQPQVKYLLKNGDVLKIANEIFVFFEN